MAERSRSRWWVWVLAFVATATDIYLSIRAATTTGAAVTGGDIGWSMVVAAFTFSGVLIVSRQPRNIIGWLLLVPGITSPIATLSTTWLLSFETAPTTVTPALWLALWFSSNSWVLAIFPVFHLMLVFPTGRLLSARWRWVVGLEIGMVGTFLFLTAISETFTMAFAEEELWTVANPLGVISDTTFWNETFPPVWGALLALLTLSCVTAMVVRYRRSGTVERHQMKWLLLAVALFGLVYAPLAFNRDDQIPWLADALFAISIASIPIAVAVAVLRYRLFEIDRLLSRTVSYALVVGLLAALFFGIVALLSTVLPNDQSDLTIAASTLAVFALFNPLRKRVQGGVDRRFNRSRYDSERVIEGFVDNLRSQLDSEQVVAGWVGVVDQTMQPSTVGVWLR